MDYSIIGNSYAFTGPYGYRGASRISMLSTIDIIFSFLCFSYSFFRSSNPPLLTIFFIFTLCLGVFTSSTMLFSSLKMPILSYLSFSSSSISCSACLLLICSSSLIIFFCVFNELCYNLVILLSRVLMLLRLYWWFSLSAVNYCLISTITVDRSWRTLIMMASLLNSLLMSCCLSAICTVDCLLSVLSRCVGLTLLRSYGNILNQCIY